MIRIGKSVGVSLAVFSAVPLAGRAYGQIRSFGEAEGFGATATGARVSLSSVSVYHVTNLNDSGAGSFRDAVSQSNRIVVFDVGGMINLKSAVSAKSNLTIAGQTAPGGGITLNGYQGVSFAGQSNVIVRYLRFRPGDNSPSTDDGVSLYNASNVILDHVSIEFAKWNNIDAVTDNGGSPNVTIQNSIIADPIGQQFGAHLEAVNGQFTLSNNLWANSHNRNPLAKVNEQFKNNVVYNYEAAYTTHTSTPFQHDLVNNAFIYGPATGGNTYYQLSSGDTFYATGNVRDTDKDGTLDTGGILNPTTGTIVSTPNFASTLDLPTMSVSDAYAYVVAHAGASLTRDELDQLVVSQVQTLGAGTSGKTVGTSGPTGGLYGSALSTGLSNGGLGTIATASRPAGFDADNDGVADAWEAAHGMSASNAADAFKLNPLGYMMIEQYINELGDVNVTRTYNAASGSLSTAASWNGGTLPMVMDRGVIAGSGAANGAASLTTGTMSFMKLDIGGNGPAAGETLSVSGGKLDVYDTMNVGANNNATLNVSGSAAVEAYNIILGNTVYAPGATNYNGVINLSGGTLAVSSLVNGAGTPGNWTGGGQLNFSGGTLKALGLLNINVPISVSGSGGTLDTNGYDGVISGAITGTGGITKNGQGTLTLTGANSMQGGVKINAGTVALNHLNAAGTGTVTLNGGNVTFGSVSGITTPISVLKSGSLTAGGITLNGAISGGDTVKLSVVTSTTGNLTLAGDLSGFLGTLDFSGSTGNVRLNALGANGSSSADFDLGSSTATLRTAFAATVNLGSLSGGASTKLQGAGNEAKAVTWVVGGNGASTTFAGTISDGTYTTPGAVNLTKTGTGTLTLSGSSTYTGVTQIYGGRLLLNGSIASSDATVHTGGTLGGTGLARSIAVDQGGFVAPGSGVGTLSASAGATLRGTLQIELNGTGTGTADRLHVGGTLDLTGATLSLTTLAALDDQAYVIANYGSLVGTFATLTNLPTGYKLTYAYNDGISSNNIAVVANPEPAIATLALPACFLLRRRRRTG